MGDDVGAIAAKLRAVLAVLLPAILQQAGELIDDAGIVL
ncbi:hypothetical protein BJ970_003637 [Saccharopolyspora phatthalungensis]|uniref:Uncharacterized protein n=1 Tax=Saccharopolyspora phatthalungensis TaxID=664693 RepID=A0A840QG37_9PSEU|nr:hypothetical protein [Saccharopolyspora phatthalungensis]